MNKLLLYSHYYSKRENEIYDLQTQNLSIPRRVSHNALDQHYSTGIPLLKAHADLVEVDRTLLIDGFRDTNDLDSEAELGRIMLEGYLQWVEDNGIDSDLEMTSTEEIISMPMFNGEVELQGKLDMRVRRKSDGVRMFRDFKTVGGSLSEFSNLAHMNEQVLTYMLLEATKADEKHRSDGGIFTMLKKVKRSATAKPPFYDQFEVRHNVYTLRAFWQRLHGVVSDLIRTKDALDNGESHFAVAYPRPNRDCKWKCEL
jgi:hypothetical protein